jgi:hypothetical protein
VPTARLPSSRSRFADNFLDHRDQIAKIHRLGNDLPNSLLSCLLNGVVRSKCGHEDTHRVGLQLFDVVVEFHAVHAGQLVIQESQPIPGPPGKFQGRWTVVSSVYHIAQVQENVCHRGAAVLVVVHQQNGCGCHSRSPAGAAVAPKRPSNTNGQWVREVSNVNLGIL